MKQSPWCPVQKQPALRCGTRAEFPADGACPGAGSQSPLSPAPAPEPGAGLGVAFLSGKGRSGSRRRLPANRSSSIWLS